MSLHESRDAYITRILYEQSDENRVVAEVSADIKQEQLSLFLRNSEMLVWDARSGLARNWLDVAPVGEFVWENYKRVGLVEVTRFHPSTFPDGSSLEKLFSNYGLIDYMYKGVPLGKINFDDPEMYLSADELIAALDPKNREVITGENFEVISKDNHGILRVPLLPEIYIPTNGYSSSDLLNIINKREPRQRLPKFQFPYEVDTIIMEPNSGIVSRIPLMTSGLEVKVLNPNIPGVAHSNANFGSQHTKFDFYLEFVNENSFAVPIGYVDLALIRPRRTKFQVTLPNSLKNGHEDELNTNPNLNNELNKFRLSSADLRKIEYIEFSDDKPGLYTRISRDDIEAQKKFYSSFMDNRDIGIIFNQFPGPINNEYSDGLSSRLIALSEERKLKSLFLNNAPNGNFFSKIGLVDIDRISRNGTSIYWKNPAIEKWTVYESGFWIKPEKIEQFRDYLRSGKIVAFYGSSEKLDKETKSLIYESLDGIMKFHGDKVGILTGGWGKPGSSMEHISKLASDKGALVGAVFWSILGQASDADLDFVQYHDEVELSARQELMGKVVEAEFYVAGGPGTDLERALTLTLTKNRIGVRKPQVYLGDAGIEKERLEMQIETGYAHSSLLNNIYVVTDGSKVYDTLSYHFKTSK
jgi:predicted Rossmann-fold nucleotide-binding protein